MSMNPLRQPSRKVGDTPRDAGGCRREISLGHAGGVKIVTICHKGWGENVLGHLSVNRLLTLTLDRR
jgi:hypothetical protein